jgi:hypothetical protein
MSFLFDKGRDRFARADLDWIDHAVRVVLTDGAAYTPNQATHEYLSSIPVGARVSEVGVTGKTTDGTGVCDGADAVLSAVTGPQSEYLALYRFVTGDADSPLIALIDSATGLPITPNGGDIEIRWSDAANKIFKI